MSHINKLILGTVQFGLPYGINNESGKPSFNTICSILDKAFDFGIYTLDTAAAYGTVIQTIGQYHNLRPHRFKIINKFQLSEGPFDIKESIRKSLSELDIDAFEAYLFHSFADFMGNPSILADLVMEKKSGNIKNIGVSVYTNEEFEMVISNSEVDIIQIPYNLLDNANKRGHLINRAKNNGKVVHTRSVFLQGLFFKPLSKYPEILKPLIPDVERLFSIAGKMKRPIQDLALNYPLQNPLIDGVLFGLETVTQLEENIKAINASIQDSIIMEIEQINVNDERLLNPVYWKN